MLLTPQSRSVTVKTMQHAKMFLSLKILCVPNITTIPTETMKLVRWQYPAADVPLQCSRGDLLAWYPVNALLSWMFSCAFCSTSSLFWTELLVSFTLSCQHCLCVNNMMCLVTLKMFTKAFLTHRWLQIRFKMAVYCFINKRKTKCVTSRFFFFRVIKCL